MREWMLAALPAFALSKDLMVTEERVGWSVCQSSALRKALGGERALRRDRDEPPRVLDDFGQEVLRCCSPGKKQKATRFSGL